MDSDEDVGGVWLLLPNVSLNQCAVSNAGGGKVRLVKSILLGLLYTLFCLFACIGFAVTVTVVYWFVISS